MGTAEWTARGGRDISDASEGVWLLAQDTIIGPSARRLQQRRMGGNGQGAGTYFGSGGALLVFSGGIVTLYMLCGGGSWGTACIPLAEGAQ